MQHFNSFTTGFMNNLRFPDEAKTCFWLLEQRLDSEAEHAAVFDDVVHGYMYPSAHGLDKALKRIDSLAEEMGVNRYTLQMVFLIACAQILLPRYRERGISEDIYWASMSDLRYKLIECMECEEVCGTFVGGWFHGFFELTRFALGRFEYEESTFNRDTVTLPNGYVIEEDSPIVNFHIPSSGVSLTDEVRLASYKQAYEYYKPLFKGGPAVFECSSWLLYTEHLDFLPEKSHIRNFINDFVILESEPSDRFNDGWRVFGKYSDLPPEQLPTDTSLRRAFAKRLIDGKPTGHGYGVIVFDGEKIISK